MVSAATSADVVVTEQVSVEGCNHRQPAVDGGTCSPAVEAIRELVLQEVDAKVTEKVDALWARGRQTLCQIQQKHLETTQQLTDEVTRCLQKQQAQEAENERLKQHLHDMAIRFSMLGNICNGVSPGAVNGGLAEAMASGGQGPGIAENQEASGIVTPPNSVPAVGGDGASSSSCSPTPPSVSATSSCGAGGLMPATSAAIGLPIPEVPAFPLLNSLLASPEPYRVADVSGSTAPTIIAATAAAAMATGGGASDNCCVFNLKLRKADGTDLGLNLSHHEHGQVLRIEAVRPDGAVDAWNKQCVGSDGSAMKAIQPGDSIISVNDVAQDAKKMLEECRDKRLLKLTIARGGIADTAGPSSSRLIPLRADAAAFVPAKMDAPLGTNDGAIPVCVGA